jgi:allophanate hydrolase subunit 2
VLTLRAILGPRDDWFTAPTDLGVGDWVVSPRSNRVGLRLDRPAPGENDSAAPVRDGAAAQQPPELRRKDSRELPSEGVVLGAVQVPPSGQPVLFLADHPVTGGYPVIAVVLDNDIDLAAQARPGQRLRFRLEPSA